MSILSGTSLSQEQQERIDTFVKNSTQGFDSSHNWQHAQQVYENTIQILQEMKMDYEQDIVTLAAKLHDVCDHKYKNSICRETLEQFIASIVGETKVKRIWDIIDNVSFSKEVAGKRMQLEHPDFEYLIIISDADRLEAIGDIGIQRCVEYTLATGGQVPRDVVQHCHDKLLLLYPKFFIKTSAARHLAKPRHQVVVDYVASHSGCGKCVIY